MRMNLNENPPINQTGEPPCPLSLEGHLQRRQQSSRLSFCLEWKHSLNETLHFCVCGEEGTVPIVTGRKQSSGGTSYSIRAGRKCEFCAFFLYLSVLLCIR
ncbi:hypothetical protein TNIN_491331 [Trichonephila inaurata madagascariensis]|uniref:Uncharacterized protein n=1 Tax=Trichonephila inaurata madagascariensis TaxID=2747483 RepID=A0A8X6YIH9_9ARAC|nr:hypothetical protein TNIN_491331 [Trichonephila inaurata madagascariensis]